MKKFFDFLMKLTRAMTGKPTGENVRDSGA